MKLSRLMGKRNQPRRSKSRWRKTLDRRHRPHVVVEANRFQPFVTIRFRARSEEELRQLQEENLRRMSILGVAGVLPLSPGAMAALEGKE